MAEPLEPLEEYLTMPTGQRVRRCQHLDPEKGQCRMPARKGELFCRHHLGQAPQGAKDAKDAKDARGAKEAKEARAALEAAQRARTAPIRHGLYTEAAGRSIREIAEAILRLEADLDNTDRELAILKGTLHWLLQRAEDFQAKAEALGELLARLEGLRPTEDAQALRALAEDLRLASRLQVGLAAWTDRLMDAAMRVVNAAKARAETRAKLAEARALEQFVRLVQAVRDILWDLLPEETLALFEDRLQREVLESVRVALPPPARPSA